MFRNSPVGSAGRSAWRRRHFLFLGFVSLLLICCPPQARAQVFPRALPQGQVPADSRLGALRTLDDAFPFTEVASEAAWKTRATAIRRQVLVANGLWPMPTPTPLEAVVHGLVDREDYTVEKVYFQSFPGHFVTGNLYRPKSTPRGIRHPAVLSPHGHWSNGRFHDHGEAALQKELAAGAERFDPSGRHPLQARCVQLARMGCVVFHYDMIGYADSQQLAHRPAENAPDMGFFSAEAELRLQSTMGLQTYNSIRALDFVLSLPDVDPERIAVTGASGGGTQTMILGAVDDRPAVLFPAVMVSTAMQGGCTCENANYLRIGAGNIDFAALAAPRPLGLTAADDWTVELESKGKPDLERLYKMLGHSDHFRVAANLQFGHNYNIVSREAMYAFMDKHLALGHEEPRNERAFQPLSQEEMSVWNDEHPAPCATMQDHERALLRWWSADSDVQLAGLEAAMADHLARLQAYDETVGGGWETIIGRTLEETGTVTYELVAKENRSGLLFMTGLLTNTTHGEQVPALFLHPEEGWNGEVFLVVDERGKEVLLDDAGRPESLVAELLAEKYSVMAIDTLHTGEFLPNGEAPPAKAKLNGTDYAGYTFGYNSPLFCRRVHDVLTAIAYIRTQTEWPVKTLHLGAKERGAALAIGALSQASEAIASTIVVTGGFRFENAREIDDAWFVPGAVKYRDLPGLLATCAPSPVLVMDESPKSMLPARLAYLGHGAEGRLQFVQQPDAEAIIDWLARNGSGQ